MSQPAESPQSTAADNPKHQEQDQSQDQQLTVEAWPVYKLAASGDTGPDPPPIKEWEEKLIGKKLVAEGAPDSENVGICKLIVGD
ncbi:hypothetical protein MMC16_004880 [Acarospora aff. strigata]|nr:hypothetical protein [Acarospora aff. strigata]